MTMIKPEHTFLLYHLCKKAQVVDGVLIVETTWQEIAAEMKHKHNRKDVTYSKNSVYRIVNSLVKSGILRRCNRSSFSFIIDQSPFLAGFSDSNELWESTNHCEETGNNEKDPNLGKQLRETVNGCDVEINEEKEPNFGKPKNGNEKDGELWEDAITCESSINDEKCPNLGKDFGKVSEGSELWEILNTGNGNELHQKNGELWEPLLNNLNNTPLSNSVKAKSCRSKELGEIRDNQNQKATTTMGNEEKSRYHTEPEHTSRTGKRHSTRKKEKGGYVKVSQLPKSKDRHSVEVHEWKPRHFVGLYRSMYYEYWRNNESERDGHSESWRNETQHSIKAGEDIKKIFDLFVDKGCENFSNIDMHRYIEWYFREWYPNHYVRYNKDLWMTEGHVHKLSIKSLMNDAPMEAFINDSGIFCAENDLVEEEEEKVQTPKEFQEEVELFYGFGLTNILARFGFVITAAYMVREGIELEEIEKQFNDSVNRSVRIIRQGGKMNHLQQFFTATIENGPYWENAPFANWRERYNVLKNHANMGNSEMEYSGSFKHDFGFLMENLGGK